MLNWLLGRSLDSALNETKKIKVQGVTFHIRKLNPLDYLNGANVLRQTYDTYKIGTKEQSPLSEADLKKIKEHYAHTLAAGIAKPKISLKDEEGSINAYKFVENWDLATEVYMEIIGHTYGKKKVKQLVSQKVS